MKQIHLFRREGWACRGILSDADARWHCLCKGTRSSFITADVTRHRKLLDTANYMSSDCNDVIIRVNGVVLGGWRSVLHRPNSAAYKRCRMTLQSRHQMSDNSRFPTECCRSTLRPPNSAAMCCTALQRYIRSLNDLCSEATVTR